MVNPEADMDCIFHNIEFKSELSLNDIDIPNSTITDIQAWNEYQNTGSVPLVVGSNMRRRLRKWKANIPRQAGTRNRIRNPWIFLKLSIDNTQNHRLVLHDVIVNYTI